MKKALALFATLGLLFMSLFAFSAPAHAGEEGVQLCHATSSETNPYVFQTHKYKQFVQGGHVDHAGDIHEAFSYKNGYGETVNVPAKNWDTVLTPSGFTGKDIWLNNCSVPESTVVSYVPPVFTQATCIDPTGSVSVPEQPEGVNYGSNQPKLNERGEWYVTFMTDKGYVFEDGSTDRTWVSEPIEQPTDAECLLPEVGAGGLINFGIGGLVLLAIGMVIFGLNRRTEKE